MATKRPTGARNETVRCENCGEYYSVTYKRCPFCDERGSRSTREGEYEEFEDEFEDDYEDDRPRRGSGGKRLVTNTRGGGYGRRISPGGVIWTVVSLLLIAAAVYIVFTAVYPLIARGKPGESANPGVSPTPSSQVSATPKPSGDAAITTGEPQDSTPPAASETPAPPATGSDTASGFSLGQQDFSLTDQWPTYQFRPTFTPDGSTAGITWTSSKPDIVAVDQNGKVSPGTTQGTATITAKMASGYEQSCIVRNQTSSSAAAGSAPGSAVTTAPSATPKPSASAAPAGLTLSRVDFTLDKAGDAWTLKVTGAASAVAWSVKDSSVATVSADGKVTAVAKGRTTVYAEVDGQKLECIVRVNG